MINILCKDTLFLLYINKNRTKKYEKDLKKIIVGYRKRKEIHVNLFPFSDSLGARTQDPILKRDVLYLLS